jgi:hypothetical protein
VEAAGSSRTLSREVVASLSTEEALVLMMDAVSKLFLELPIGIGWDMADIPEMEPGPDLKLFEAADMGLLSGNKALTNVTRSAGLITRYGCTSTVSRRDVIDLAGKSLVVGTLDREPWNLDRMLSTWPLIFGGTSTGTQVADGLPLHMLETYSCPFIATFLKIFSRA